MAGAKTAIRSANLELWQCPSTGELLASLGQSPTEKKARISPFLNFLGGGELKELVSDEDSTALKNWVEDGKDSGKKHTDSLSAIRVPPEGLLYGVVTGSTSVSCHLFFEKRLLRFVNRNSVNYGLLTAIGTQFASSPAGAFEPK